RPRVWFGERWITSIFDLFEENVRYFPPLLPICDDEDPVEVLQSGGVPRLGELRLHNGTVYRWNRPVYDIMNGRPHLRVENRVLPAGPTVVDMLANAAFYFGLAREMAEADRPIWSQLTFSAAEENFHAAARRGIDATVYWPRLGDVRVTELVLDTLLPKAYAGLDRFGVHPAQRDRLLGIIEQRCRTGRNGAVWQVDSVLAAQRRRGLDRPAALHDMALRYSELQRTNEPVHTWPVE
ncbi:MAG TPA: glutamate--cysteine ligase, partial [Micromonosporaceae bacterium]|nr:glutamate--cysteine ligase [Micromonosporaceae bacterium]